MRTPETLTAAQRAERLKLADLDSDSAADGEASTKESPVSSKNDRYRAQARESLSLGTPRNATANLDPKTEADMSFSLLNIEDIEPYRYNPRTGSNPRYEEIKASIRADGITNMLTVTRRPHADKYSPYGGGNTRLRIARELFDEGDRRFERLHVLVKSWPGEAAVISAHLAENENRGDISFWEKAQGVAAFKREIEAATGRALSSTELNKELRELGVGYGLKTIQNFAFSVNYLTPVGEWLKAAAVNAVIRPSVSSYVDVSDALGKKSEAREAIHNVLVQHRQHLATLEQRNAERDEGEQIPVELDTDELLVDLQKAVAAVLEVDAASVPLMASALAQNSRIDANSLRHVKVKAAPALAPAESAMAGVRQQLPMGGMLAAVPKRGGASSASRPPAVPSSGTKVGAQDDAAEPVLPSEAQITSEAGPLQRDLGEINACFRVLNELVPLYDVINTAPTMPFGFLCDFPEEAMDKIEGQPVSSPASEYRIVLWKLLVAVSGQLNHEVSQRIPATATTVRWIAALTAGPETFTRIAHEQGHTIFTDGDIFASGIEIAMLFNRDDVGSAVVNLLSTLQRFRSKYPERFPTRHVPLFPDS